MVKGGGEIMVKVREDMTGWKMWEHGIEGSRLTVLEQTEDYVRSDGRHEAQWLCECLCKDHKRIKARGNLLKCGDIKSCGCLYAETFNKGNKKDLSGEFGILWSSNTNEEIYFDIEDADEILKHTWHKDNTGYASTSINGKLIRMHTLLGYYRPDHYNRNKLDNRRCNLISCTIRENNANRPAQTSNSSGIIGVYFNKLRLKWVAQINDSKNHCKSLGSFKQKDDAIKARLNAEKEYYGEFAPQKHLFEKYGILEDNQGDDEIDCG